MVDFVAFGLQWSSIAPAATDMGWPMLLQQQQRQCPPPAARTFACRCGLWQLRAPTALSALCDAHHHNVMGVQGVCISESAWNNS